MKCQYLPSLFTHFESTNHWKKNLLPLLLQNILCYDEKIIFYDMRSRRETEKSLGNSPMELIRTHTFISGSLATFSCSVIQIVVLEGSKFKREKSDWKGSSFTMLCLYAKKDLFEHKNGNKIFFLLEYYHKKFKAFIIFLLYHLSYPKDQLVKKSRFSVKNIFFHQDATGHNNICGLISTKT